MKIALINCSVVLLTQDQGASINHEFLVDKKIIPKDFQKNPNSFSTPVVSQIHYNNGFSILIEPNKTQFQIANTQENESNNLQIVKDISSKYLNFFNPKYKAIGINFDFIRDSLGYQSFIEKIIKMDSPYLNFDNHKGNIRKIDLSYNIKGKQFNIAVIRAEHIKDNLQPQETNKTFVPYFKVNVHYPKNYNNNAVNIIEELIEDYKKSKKFIEDFK